MLERRRRKRLEMLAPFGLLPLLEGWNYEIYNIPASVLIRGEPPKLFKRVKLPGWLLYIILYTNDAYTTLRVRWKGPAGTELLTGIFCPQEAYELGATAQDPSGWVQLYDRPDPKSTAGRYFLVGFSGGFQGSPFPFVPDVKLEAYLPEESTQLASVFTASAGVITIADKRSFLESLRRALWGPTTPLREELTRLAEALKEARGK